MLILGVLGRSVNFKIPKKFLCRGPVFPDYLPVSDDYGLIVFTDANYSGSLPTFKISKKSFILYVGRVLHPPQSKTIVTHNPDAR